MSLNINKEVAAMKRMTTAELKAQFEHVCGESPRSTNRDWLTKKIAWRLQANDEGGLPERVRQFALGIANDANLRIRPPRSFTQAVDSAHEQTVLPTSGSRDQRLPPPGTIILKKYKGKQLAVLIRQDNFEFNGEIYPTHSAIANVVTGSHVNGFTFFKLSAKKEACR